MIKPHLQLNLYDKLVAAAGIYPCTSSVYTTFLGESIQRVDCVASFSGCHLNFCCLLNDKRQKTGQGVHRNEAAETVCS